MQQKEDYDTVKVQSAGNEAGYLTASNRNESGETYQIIAVKCYLRSRSIVFIWVSVLTILTFTNIYT